MTEITQGFYWTRVAMGQAPIVLERLNGKWWAPGHNDPVVDADVTVIERVAAPGELEKKP